MIVGYLSEGVIVGRRSCAVCGKKFNPSSRGMRYCSVRCMRRRFDKWASRVGLRLVCENRRCGRTFVIGDRNDGKPDKRTRFCCAACERQHWRDVTRHPKNTAREAQTHAETPEAAE